MPGILYVVATPIGNLGDISDRAREVLSVVDIIAAENTRHARKLLSKIDFSGKLLAYHDFSDKRQQRMLLDELLGGKTVALISDAGTPLISDPGFKLVRLARDQGISVLPIPGPSALTASLSVSGIATDRFVFEGFLPSRDNARRQRLDMLKEETRTLVFYEAPHRIVASVATMLECFGAERSLFIARELTKKFEEHFLGTLEEGLRWLQQSSLRQRGEIVIVLSGASESERQRRAHEAAFSLLERLQDEMPLSKAIGLVVDITGVRKNSIYNRAQLLNSTRQSDE
ncbi:MAG: 16S rRNA (cytidine(1402)-2'-O)-methyltransferase [Gammaproteobacteria bacterium]|nr:16S rRNA (cytidine(1402)-2'-O)-methyltransferase [Gammaproteobacteria bacterium]MCY4358697.1 16S rRNA (cytidine(1402)-2'-O)-methyltransferase [Gammaproteobacteria bacterium]